MGLGISTATLAVRRQSSNALSSLEENDFKARTFYPAKLLIKYECRTITFPDIQFFQEATGGRLFTEMRE